MISALICVTWYWAAKVSVRHHVASQRDTFSRIFEALDNMVYSFNRSAPTPLRLSYLVGIPAAGCYKVVEIQHESGRIAETGGGAWKDGGVSRVCSPEYCFSVPAYSMRGTAKSTQSEGATLQGVFLPKLGYNIQFTLGRQAKPITDTHCYLFQLSKSYSILRTAREEPPSYRDYREGSGCYLTPPKNSNTSIHFAQENDRETFTLREVTLIIHDEVGQ